MGYQEYIINCTKRDLLGIKRYAEENGYDSVQIKKDGQGAYNVCGDYGFGHEPTSDTCFYLTTEELVNIMNNTRDVGEEEDVVVSVKVGPIGNATSIILRGMKPIDVTDYSVW